APAKDAEAAKIAAADTKPRPEPAEETPPPPEPADRAKAADVAKAKPANPPAVPAGSAGIAEKADGILLRSDEGKRRWDRLVEEAALKTSDRLLCLEPCRAAIDVGKVRIGLVRETEVRVLSGPSDPEPAIELLQGRIAIRRPGTSVLKVTFGRETI